VYFLTDFPGLPLSLEDLLKTILKTIRLAAGADAREKKKGTKKQRQKES